MCFLCRDVPIATHGTGEWRECRKQHSAGWWTIRQGELLIHSTCFYVGSSHVLNPSNMRAFPRDGRALSSCKSNLIAIFPSSSTDLGTFMTPGAGQSNAWELKFKWLVGLDGRKRGSIPVSVPLGEDILPRLWRRFRKIFSFQIHN